MEEEQVQPPEEDDTPTILLQLDANGDWQIKSNIKNPERILRMIGARLVIRNEQ